MCAENHQTSGTTIWSWLFCTVTLLAWNTKPLPLCFETMNTQWVVVPDQVWLPPCSMIIWNWKCELFLVCFAISTVGVDFSWAIMSCDPQRHGKRPKQRAFCGNRWTKTTKRAKGAILKSVTDSSRDLEKIRMKSHVLRFSKRDLHRLSSPASPSHPPPVPHPLEQRWNCKICIHDIMKDSSGTYYIMVPMEASRLTNSQTTCRQPSWMRWKPIFKDLAKTELFQKCLAGYTQHANECLNSIIWKFCPG